MSKYGLAVLIILTGIATPNAIGQCKDFSGTWNLNVTKSFMGSDHPTSDYRLTKTIVQENGRISVIDNSVHASMAGMSLPDTVTTMRFVPDGKDYEMKLPSAFPGIPETPGTVSAAWQGCTLEIHQEIAAFGSSTKERLFLSEDGTKLIDLVEGQSTFMDTEQRLVFDKKD